MWKLIGIFVQLLVMVKTQGNYNAQGEGVWATKDIDQCEEKIENPIMSVEVQRRRINHTHESFDVTIDATRDIDETFGVYIDVCKYLDGGCKHYQNIIDGLEKLLNKHAKENVKRAFQSAGVDPPEFPIPEGHHVIQNFILDYCELPTFCPYGRYEATAYVVKDEAHVGCIKVLVEFSEDDELCAS